MPPQLREMFGFMLLNCDISNPLDLWEHFREYFIQDFTRGGDSESVAEQKALAYIESIFKSSSKSLQHYGLPYTNFTATPPDNPQDIDHFLWQDMQDTLTPEQQSVFVRVQDAVANYQDPNEPDTHVFFIDGPGGSGKTYLYNLLIEYYKRHNQKVMPSAMTGIAATLLPGGQTAHKTFAIPVPCLDNSTCRISPSSEYAQLLRQVLIFLIDEASMLSRYQFEAIDRLMRDITGKDIPFGGKIFILGGDLRQTLPVVRRASDTVIIENSIISSHLWSIVERFRLTRNMRANPGQDEFTSFLLDMGQGNRPLKNTAPFAESIEIPSNREASSVNSIILDRLPGQQHVYSSVDSIVDLEDVEERENYTGVLEQHRTIWHA